MDYTDPNPEDRHRMNYADLTALSELLSKSALLPEPLQGHPEDIAVLVLTGAELGLGPMQSLNSLRILEGVPTLSAEAIVARVKSRPEVCLYFTLAESTDRAATYETQRAGAPGPERLTFTLEDADLAGLTNSPFWTKYPADLLRARASSRLARIVYPDLVAGLALAEDIPTPLERPANPPSEPTPQDLADRITPQTKRKVSTGRRRTSSTREVEGRIAGPLDSRRGSSQRGPR